MIRLRLVDVKPRLISVDADLALGVWNRTVVHIWRGAPTVENVAKMVASCQKLIDAGGGVTCIAIVERGSPAPGEVARHALAAWSRDIVPKMASAVLVAEGSGFRSALVRGVGVALTTLMPHKVPFKFASSVEEGAVLVAQFLPEKAHGPSELMLAIAGARSRWEQAL